MNGIQEDERKAATYIPLYKGKCPKKNLFSMLDGKAEGQEEGWRFVESIYRDDWSLSNLIQLSSNAKLLQDIPLTHSDCEIYHLTFSLKFFSSKFFLFHIVIMGSILNVDW